MKMMLGDKKAVLTVLSMDKALKSYYVTHLHKSIAWRSFLKNDIIFKLLMFKRLNIRLLKMKNI